MDTSCLRIVLALCLLATHCFAANPTVFIPWTAPRGTGGITVTTNPAAGTFTISGAALTGIVPPWTNNGTYIFPLNQTNAIHINRVTGGIIIGTNGIGTVVDSEIFRAVFDSTMGDPSAATWTLEANTTGAGTYGGSLLNVNAAGDAYFALYNHKGTGFGLEFNINAADGVTPFALNATVAHTSGSLLSVSNFDVGKFDVAHNGMIWSATNKFAFATTTNVWPLTNAVAGQVLTSAGGAGAQLYWSTASGGSGPSFADLVWTNSAGLVQPVSTNVYQLLFVNDVDSTAQFESTFTFGNTSPSVLVDNPGFLNYISIQPFLDPATPEVDIDINAVGTNTQGRLRFFVGAGVDEMFWTGTAVTFMDLYPTAGSGTAYYFNTSPALPPGSMIAAFDNAGVTHFTFGATNGFSTPAITAYGAVSKAWQFGAASNTVNVQLEATNVVEITVAGVAYLIPAKLK